MVANECRCRVRSCHDPANGRHGRVNEGHGRANRACFLLLRESWDHLAQRALGFMKWLMDRPEKVIAVTCHGSFLITLFIVVLGFPASVEQAFHTAEIRSVHVLDSAAERARRVAILVGLFNRMDQDKNGKLSLEELRSVYGHDAQEAMESCDADGDGFVTPEEWAGFILDKMPCEAYQLCVDSVEEALSNAGQ
eukprot:TRINITY_DN5960_c0_g1_i3.p1 TRINITY_DN5960_c0_g1~~TRINITY_DN5960_c0_g1_i3.p1  ORF type:complete len:194 (-),score=31.54 TRINITY_DN5960_c0_g1_i3:229-810(-)